MPGPTTTTAGLHKSSQSGDAAPAVPLPNSSTPQRTRSAHWRHFFCGAAILLLGVSLRVLPCFGVPDQLSMDEVLYINNVIMVKAVGPFNYPALVEHYVERQTKEQMVMLPPTRFVYIFSGWAWGELFGVAPAVALRCVAASFSVLTFLLSGWFAYRLGGLRMGFVVASLMAVAPMELMLAHRELADGVFAFWALLNLWLLWENLQAPGRFGWLAAYAGGIAAMVLTKENAFFAAVGLGGIITIATLFPKLNIGKPRWSTLVATIVGGLAGVLVLICLAGSPRTLLATYELLVTKAEKMAFAYASGGGPWFRYVVDLMLVSPTVLLPAIGGIFALKRDSRQGIFLLLFVLLSCAIMVNVRNGMNLRYATMWDMPIRFFAATIILRIADGVRRAPILAAACIVVLIGGVEFHQYWLLFVNHDIGDPIPQFLMRALEITRPAQM